MQRLVTENDWSPVIWNVYHIVTIVVMYIALALTLISMIDYFYKNRAGFSTDK